MGIEFVKRHLATLESTLGFLLYALGFKYALQLLLSLPHLPSAWTQRMIAPYGWEDPTRVWVEKSPLLEILCVAVYFTGIILFSDGFRRRDPIPAWGLLWAILAGFALLIVTLGVGFIVAFSLSMLPP